MTDEIHSCNLHCENPACIKAQRDDLRQRYFDLCDLQARSLRQAEILGRSNATSAVADFQERLADAIEAMPFGDTADSFAIYVRNFK